MSHVTRTALALTVQRDGIHGAARGRAEERTATLRAVWRARFREERGAADVNAD